MRVGVLATAALLLTPVLAEASEPVWVFIEPPSAEAERDFEKAKEDAKADIAAGVLNVRVGGLFWQPDEERQRLLAKLGIKEVPQGCVVIENVYSKAYYETIEKEVERRYGKDFWSRFDSELAASQANAPKGDPAADRKYWRAVADHVGSYWKVPPDLPGGRRCSALILYDAYSGAAETQLLACPDSRLQSSVVQAVQASLPLPAEIVALRTPGRLPITFVVPQDQVGQDEVPWWDGEWQSIEDFVRGSADPTQQTSLAISRQR